jgi:hypothetical protein
LKATIQIMDSFNSSHQGRSFYPITKKNAYQRHLELISSYQRYHGSEGEGVSKGKTDLDVIREEHKFLMDGSEVDDGRWESRLALRSGSN